MESTDILSRVLLEEKNLKSVNYHHRGSSTCRTLVAERLKITIFGSERFDTFSLLLLSALQVLAFTFLVPFYAFAALRFAILSFFICYAFRLLCSISHAFLSFCIS